VQGISTTIKGVIAKDDKTLRRSHDQAAGKKALHLVSAWAVENRLVLAQLATEEKSNEITAIPLLLTIRRGWQRAIMAVFGQLLL
jgi:hypothetical protein